MKKVLLIAMLLLVVGISNAYAVPVTFNVDQLYDWGRLYSYAGGVFTPANSNQPLGLDPAVGYTIPQNTPLNNDGVEDSWGIGSIASITSNPVAVTYFQRGTQELTLMFYGFDDDFLQTPGLLLPTLPSIIGTTGGRVLVYLDDTNPGSGDGTSPFSQANGVADRGALNSYTGTTDGTLVLDLVPRGFLTPFGFTMTESFQPGSLAGDVTIGGSMYLDIAGGTWASLYNTDAQVGGTDFSFTFTGRLDQNSNATWVFTGDGGGDGDIVPEPASMILMGIGLLGAVRLRRKS